MAADQPTFEIRKLDLRRMFEQVGEAVADKELMKSLEGDEVVGEAAKAAITATRRLGNLIGIKWDDQVVPDTK